jgi:hypothetical protein
MASDDIAKSGGSSEHSASKPETFQADVYAVSDSDEDGQVFEKNPFLDPDVASHWAAVYEKSDYECRHVFDPAATWTEEEERKLVRRLDWRVCLWAVSFSAPRGHQITDVLLVCHVLRSTS